jgi:citronellyl-CoA dehydrogenase
LANTSDEDSHKNKSLILIPASTKGVSVGNKIEKLGQITSDTAPVHFDNVRIPKRFCIGKEGQGFNIQMQQLQEERLFLAVSVITVLEKCINTTIEYCRDRTTFGKPVIENQQIHFRLAELQTEVEALRSLTYQACELFMSGKDMTYLASMAKLKSGRLCREVSDVCLQYWGGMGYTWENPASKIYRDGRLTSIAGGTDEIMLQVVCKKMGMI